MKAISRAILFILGGALLLGVGFYGGLTYTPPAEPEPEIDVSVIQAQISDCSDLTTSKLSYTGFVHFEEGQVPLLTKKEFSMTYDAQARAGVDLSQAKVSVQDKQIRVQIPEATVQVIAIDPESLEFFDTKRALFNWQDRSDAATALEAAEADMKNNIDQSLLISEANKQAHIVIEELLAPFTTEEAGYALVIE